MEKNERFPQNLTNYTEQEPFPMKSTTKDSVLFTPIKMGSIVIPNRFVRSATHDFMAADDGLITERQVTLYNNLSEGKAKLIISGHA